MFAPLDMGRYLRLTKDVTQLYEARIAQAGARCGVSKPEADVLLFLANSPQCNTARDACEIRRFSKAYVSKAVERLCVRGFLHVAVAAEDRRVQHLTVLPAAQAVVAALRDAQQAFFGMLTVGLTTADEAALTQAFLCISDNVLRAMRE